MEILPFHSFPVVILGLSSFVAPLLYSLFSALSLSLSWQTGSLNPVSPLPTRSPFLNCFFNPAEPKTETSDPFSALVSHVGSIVHFFLFCVSQGVENSRFPPHSVVSARNLGIILQICYEVPAIAQTQDNPLCGFLPVSDRPLDYPCCFPSN